MEYFTTRWWQGLDIRQFINKVDDLYPTQTPEFKERVAQATLAQYLQSADKSRTDRKLVWLDGFSIALFLCGLASRFSDLAKICSWFDETGIEPEYSAGTIENEYQLMFVYIGCRLNPSPPDGTEELLNKVKKCRLKRPRLLCKLWESIESQDQKAFGDALIKNVDRLLEKPEDGQLYKWVDIDSSSLLMLAKQRGLKCPPLTDKQSAALVTPESAGMVD